MARLSKGFLLLLLSVCILGFNLTPAQAQDTDSDGVLDANDNCITVPNGPNQGTCTKGTIGIACMADGTCGTGGFCSMNQEDTIPPPDGDGVGDACDCEGNFDCDVDQDGSDAATFKKHFGRSTFKNPCTYDNPCYGDFDKDADADGSDAAKFKEDFGRSGFSKACPQCKRPIGVIFTVHGGQVTNINEFTWNTGVQQFSYDPNNSVYKLAIWNPAYWDFVLQAESSLKFLGKFEFEYPQIGGIDPFPALTDQQFADMEAALDANTKGLNFEVDWAGWMCGDCVDHYPYPRFIYYGPDGPAVGTNCTYCGEFEKVDVILDFDNGTSALNTGATLTGQTSGATAQINGVTLTSGSWSGGNAAGTLSLTVLAGRFSDNETITDNGTIPGSATANGTVKWPGCNPARFNVDGPAERLLKKGVYRIIMVDLTVGGVRFSKTYDVKNMVQKALDDWKNTYGVTTPLLWVNDFSDLMKRSFPILPAGWTRSMGTPPTQDSAVLKNGSPNPVASDPDLATLQREAIEASFSASVPDANTGVIIMNHAINDLDEYFDPKMDDTITLNENIKSQLVSLHPTMDPDSIIGARMGIKVQNPEAQHTLLERTREMRGENLGHQYLYQTAKLFPSGGSDPFGLYHPWGYLYWDAIDYLVNTKGVQHIVIGFPQIITSSVLDMVEFPNQIGKEIGIKNWALWGTGDFTRYPLTGTPFADYWGNWVYQDCGEWELLFDNGTQEIAGGGTNPVTLVGAAKLVGNTSGATGVIKQVIVESGSWGTANAAGRIILKDVVGTFSDNETIHDDKTPLGNALANGTQSQTISSNCCFVMGGCPNDPLPRPYPPARLTPLPDRAHDMDPSLAYDLSDFGHLGYDPSLGAPDPDNSVQDQYTGTWEMYAPPDNDPRVGELLAKHVMNAITKPMVYLSNGEKAGITVGQSVTFTATVVTGGKPAYAYAWSIKEAADPGWTAVGTSTNTWTWTPQSGDEGTYAVRCIVTDSLSESGEVTWEGFTVSAP